MSGPGGKPFDISKCLVVRAWKQVKANKGAAGVDGVSVEEFEADLKVNLYKIWNRMSSGTYFPPSVRAVEIPKADGGTRVLGVPTVGDRVAQTVAALTLEPRTESIFHDDSYGYRPGRSALDAVATCRQRCWSKSWVIDLDVAKFFDSVPWDLMVTAVQANVTHEQCWIVLYVKRWLAAPICTPEGRVVERERGTPQGSAISRIGEPVHALRVHTWLEREFPTVMFERYADDAVVHCGPSGRPERCLLHWKHGCSRSDCSCIRSKRRSCTARTATGVSNVRTPRSRFWGTRSGPGRLRRGTSRACSRRSCPRPVLPLSPVWARLFDPGGCIYAPQPIWRNWRSGSTRSFAAG